MPAPATVLMVADDAATRGTVRALLESDPLVSVVAVVCTEAEALERVTARRPDAVIVDAGLRGADPLALVGTLAGVFALPVLVLSPLTFEGAQAAIDALQRGALDFLPSEFDTLRIDEVRDELVMKVRQAVQMTSRFGADMALPAEALGPGAPPRPSAGAAGAAPPSGPFAAVLAALSTGGPKALLEMLPRIAAGFPLGMVVVQHSPASFTRTLADRLDALSALRVAEARDGDAVEPGRILIAPGSRHLTFRRDGTVMRVVLSDTPLASLYRPSADVTLASAAGTFGAPLLGLIMTGMGNDGLQGTREIKREGGRVVVQEQRSCAAPGMPLAVLKAGLADSVLPLDAFPRMLGSVLAAQRGGGRMSD